MRDYVDARRRHAAPRYHAVPAERAERPDALEARRAEAACQEAAKFFCDLRRGLRLARVAVANRIGTEAAVIEALEIGALDRLPAWPQTVRVVTEYTRLVGLDPRPVLHALHGAVIQHQKQLAKEGWAKRLLRKSAVLRRTLNEARQSRLQVLTWGAGIAVPTVLVASLMLTTGLQASQLRLPSMLGLEATERAESIKRLEGLVWIDAADPRQRRADKLPAPAR